MGEFFITNALKWVLNFGAWGGTALIFFNQVTGDLLKNSIKLGDGTSETIGYLVVGFWIIKGVVYSFEKYHSIRRDIESFKIEKKERYQKMRLEEQKSKKDETKL